MLYFAYGSNLWLPRLQCRVGAVRPVGIARLDHHVLAWHKMSKDGSGKCDIDQASDSFVLGVLYEVSPDKMELLDEAEGVGNGYRRTTLSVILGGHSTSAISYKAEAGHIDRGAAPYDWYKELVVAGARAHGLPDAYVAHLLNVGTKADPRPLRAAKERAQLELSPRHA